MTTATEAYAGYTGYTGTAAMLGDRAIAEQQAILDLDLDDLLTVVTAHTDRCGWCDPHTLCERGTAVLTGVLAVIAGWPTIA